MLTFSTILPIEPMEVYNLCSFYEGLQNIDLVPPFRIIDTGSNEADLAYMQWIFGNEVPYNNFMDIICKLHEHHKICIMVMPDDDVSSIVESLQKLISERYGIISNNVYSIEDWYNLEDIGPSTREQMWNFDKDRDAYLSYLMEKQKQRVE